MAKKTLYDFRAENGIWRSDLAKKIGFDEKTLEFAEQESEVPVEIAEKIIEVYGLEEDYFTFDPKSKELRLRPEKPFKYFFKVAIAWEFIIATVFTIVTLPTTLAVMFGPGENIIFDLAEAFCRGIITAFSGVYLTSYIVRKTVYGKQLVQYDYIYPYLPVQITLCISIIVNLIPIIFGETVANNKILTLVIGYVFAVVGLVIKGVITAVLLNSRIEEDAKKREKTVKKMSLIAILSGAIYAGFYVTISIFSDAVLSPIRLATIVADFVLLIFVVFGIIVGHKKLQKLNKLWLIILPLIAMLLPTILNAIDIIL